MSSTWAPDYAFYCDEYKGKAPEAAFDEQLPGAVAHVDWLIGFKDVPDAALTAYKRAVCAALEAFAVYGTGPVGGFSVGGFRHSSYVGVGSKSGKDIATEDASRELSGSGLLYAGVR